MLVHYNLCTDGLHASQMVTTSNSFCIGYIRATVRSEGCDDPGKRGGCGKASVWVNGRSLAKGRRGHNVVVLNYNTGI